MEATMQLPQEVQAALDFIGRIGDTLPAYDNDMITGRHFYREFITLAGPAEAVHHIEDRLLAGIPVRMYRPAATPDLPVVVYFHGGWFYLGDLDTHDRPLRALANAAGCVVIAVDYGLAPERPFPAGIQDAWAVLQAVAAEATALGVDSQRIAVAGDSAGGALAAVVARRAVQEGGPQITLQVLVYPVTDAALDAPSWKTFANGPNLDLAGAIIAWDLYVPDKVARLHPDVSPLRATDLTGLPPALVITAEYDPLRDEGLAYAQALKAAGVAVQSSLYKGMIHGFFQMGGVIPDGKKAIGEVADTLRRYFFTTAV
ncbi:alpha/beta hydrolase [Chitinophaga nivalis]|uniref:Alpha/beta hydrolase n=1 Tax=Chitinophaga nivalis TaxID=2991709 RepID=A0ABT3IRL6_9BACT|nr:alpha/beta hydrolase [Chitinophaga nivalis]MCW3463693.1 alpha/beta hydrolase [Chitinophaga nivalis]MCW3486617.1 alpha/beta hydrolase [Chitinophaga nivalis]